MELPARTRLQGEIRMRILPMVLALALAAMAAMASTSEASLNYCGHCGCQRHCKKVCRLICGKKTQTKTEYECKSEDFCIPGRSIKCGEKCECNRLGIKCCHAVLKPVCAQVRTKRVLVKKQTEKEVPDYKWIVEKVCCHCGEKLSDDVAAGGRSGQEDKSVHAPPSEKPQSGSEGDVKQAAAEEVLDDASPAGDYAAFVSDDRSPAAEAPQRRGWFQALFGDE